MPVARGRSNVRSLYGLAGMVGLVLAFATGCADVWGFDDLKVKPDAADDATSADTGTGHDAGTDADAGTSMGNSDAAPFCNQPGTILNCGGCDQQCDLAHSNGPACVADSLCTYRDCATGWLDCDQDAAPNTNGCETSNTSPTSCGACGVACDTLHSVGATCVLGDGGGFICQYMGCQPGWGDCKTDAPDTDGCETPLNTTKDCAGCGNACDTKNSVGAMCDGTTCVYKGGCAAGYGDCMATAPDTDGCETMVPTNSCNACGTSCDTVHSDNATCDTTTSPGRPFCSYTKCEPGYADCNATSPDTNGCETQITTPANCGACGRACDTMNSTGAACSGTNCSYGPCKPGFANCDTSGGDTNGCESSLSSTTSCGGCGAKCSTKTGPASCDGTTCSYKCNAGLTDCNAGTAPNTDGCECATPGCCGGGTCQSSHSNGAGQTFFDCNALGTHNAAQATAACEAFAGKGACSGSSQCCGLLGTCLLASMAQSECGSVNGKCLCWQYAGTPATVGTVQVIGSGKCAAACGSASDTPWN